jgi:hypothetical protein
MGNGVLPHGPSYRAHPRLYLTGGSLRRENTAVVGNGADANWAVSAPPAKLCSERIGAHFDLQPPRHISTLHLDTEAWHGAGVLWCCRAAASSGSPDAGVGRLIPISNFVTL